MNSSMIGKTIVNVEMGISAHPDGFSNTKDTMKIYFSDGTFSLFTAKPKYHPRSYEPIAEIVEETW